jgi:hypothetical protein
MSNYKNFIWDFSDRCNDILNDIEKRQFFRDREVTSMIAIASAGLLVPYERLKGKNHPSRDREKFEAAALKIDELTKNDFITSLLDGNPGTWRYNELENELGDVDSWVQHSAPIACMDEIVPDRKKLKERKKSKYILGCIRNSLAHGNIFTLGENKIEEIVLISKIYYERSELSVLIVSPSDFRRFLNKWFSFIKRIEIPISPVGEDSEKYAVGA